MLQRSLITYIYWCFKTLVVPEEKITGENIHKKLLGTETQPRKWKLWHTRVSTTKCLELCCCRKMLLTSQKVQLETKFSFTLRNFRHFETNCASPHNVFGTMRQNWNFCHQIFGTENKFVHLTTKFSTLSGKNVISAKQIFQNFWYSGEIM